MINQGAMEDKDTEKKPAWQTFAESMRTRAQELRDYSNSPVNTDTSGRRDYYHEFVNSRLAKAQETPEQQQAREKREKTTRRLAALADGLVALSNVAGAMGGATPVTPTTSMSAAHKKAVDAAAAKRKELAEKYDVARKHAATLALKQDAENYKRWLQGVESRRKAGVQADNLLGKAATLELQGAKADRSNEMSERRQEETERHNRASEGQGAERINISKSKSSGNQQADFDEYALWKEAHPEEVEQIRSDNAQIDILGNPTKAVTNTIVKLTNASMRRKYGSPQRQKNSAAGQGTPKKKSPTGGGGKKSPTA